MPPAELMLRQLWGKLILKESFMPIVWCELFSIHVLALQQQQEDMTFDRLEDILSSKSEAAPLTEVEQIAQDEVQYV